MTYGLSENSSAEQTSATTAFSRRLSQPLFSAKLLYTQTLPLFLMLCQHRERGLLVIPAQAGMTVPKIQGLTKYQEFRQSFARTGRLQNHYRIQKALSF
jgi:hypothetical protein